MGLALHKTVTSVHLDAIKPMCNEMTSWSVHFSFFTEFLIPRSSLWASIQLYHIHIFIFKRYGWNSYFKHVWPVLTETWVLSTHGSDQQYVTESWRVGGISSRGTSLLLLWNDRARESKTTSILTDSPKFILQEIDTYHTLLILSILKDLVKNLKQGPVFSYLTTTEKCLI